MNQTKTRNGAVDLMRLVFCICIVLQHAVSAIPEDTPAILSRGALGVEFFFLVSGYLLACSAYRYVADGGQKPSVGIAAAQFTKKKINALMPVLVIAPIFSFILIQCSKRVTIISILQKSMIEIWRPMLLMEAGFGNTNELWYISSMVLLMLAIYPVLIRHFDLFVRVIAPLVFAFSIGWLYVKDQSLLDPGKYLGFVYKGMVRAMGEICLGVAVYPAIRYLQRFELTRLAKWLITLAEIVCVVSVVCLMLQSEGEYDFFALLLIALLVVFLFSHQGIIADAMDCRFCYFCGKFSLYLYLCNNWVAKTVGNCYEFLAEQGKFGLGADVSADRTVILLLYFCGVLIASVGMYLLCETLRKHRARIFGFFKRIFVKKPETGNS